MKIFRALYISLIVGAALLSLFTTSCKSEVGYTTVQIRDSIRHYYPILQGQQLRIALRVENTGAVPLIVNEVQPSCGCITTDFTGKTIIPPGKFMYVIVVYDSNKNKGNVNHSVRFWGNIAPDGMAIMKFDVNIVPEGNNHWDYEELFEKNRPKVKDFVDGIGSETGLGYYTDFQ